ncbi:thiamine diphosphokinase [Agrobacterium sp. a22-2]|uniref:thiamine diphosphokinase n=1 Tax=Agrobacterium sp. a22-2 TaxID=2283840 RepID=UPI0014474D25|nr:thiamine diphosphokinase [Agrobacterium sp. a22-2]NKN36884.1 thiamine diphosphokinase [Agrobacterium sp. a22-2]
MTQNTFTILLGGNLTLTDRLKAAVSGSRFIAADGGMRHAAMLGATPELWVGDFDSTSDTLAQNFPDVEKMPYPAAKNETDGAIAIGEALKRGATRLILAGALGGERSDHALMHLLQGVEFARQGLKLMLTSGEEEAYPLLPGDMSLDLPEGSLFSVLGFTDLRGLSIRNARYPLVDFTLPFGSSRTISNVANGTIALSLQSGDAVLLARPYDLSGA